MQYILILYILWSEPYPHHETLIVEPFNSIAECTKTGRALGNATEADGVMGYTISCELDPSMKV